MFGLLPHKKISSLNFKVDIQKLRKVTKVVVVDDDTDAFPVEIMSENGYTIEQKTKVDFPLLERMERGEYDIIILDIIGICDEKISENGGLGIMERIKNVNPGQIIIAFSGQMYDIEKAKFWEMADEKLRKPIDLVKAKSVLDGVIRNRISPSVYWDNLQELLK